MELSNLHGLPAPLAQAINKGDVFIPGATHLSKITEPPQITALKKKHGIHADVSDMMWVAIKHSLIRFIEQGSEHTSVYRATETVFKAMNQQVLLLKSKDPNDPMIEELQSAMKSMEKYATTYHPIHKNNWLVRYTFQCAYDVHMPRLRDDEGKLSPSRTVEQKIYTTIDMFDRSTATLYLVEYVNVSQAYKPEMRTQWEQKASLQAYVLEANNVRVNKIEAILIFRDWQQGRAQASANGFTKGDVYPKHQWKAVPLMLMDQGDIEKILNDSLVSRIIAEETGFMECTPAQRYKETDTYMLYNPTARLRPVLKKGFHTAEEAARWKKDNFMLASTSQIEMEPGANVRCEKYCPVAEHCLQFKALKEEDEKSRGNIVRKLPDHLIDNGDEFKMRG